MDERHSLFRKSNEPVQERCLICNSVLVYNPEDNFFYCSKCKFGVSGSNKPCNTIKVEPETAFQREKSSLFRKSDQENKPQNILDVNLVKKSDGEYVELSIDGTVEAPGLGTITVALRGAVQHLKVDSLKDRWFCFNVNSFTSRLEQYRSPHDKLGWDKKYIRKKDFDKLIEYVEKALKLDVPSRDREVLEKGLMPQYKSQELFKKPRMIVKDYLGEKESKYDALNKILMLIESSEEDLDVIDSIDSLLKLNLEPKFGTFSELDERIFDDLENLLMSHDSVLVKCAAIRPFFYLFPKHSLEPLFFLILKYEPKLSSSLSDIIELFNRFIDVLKQPLSNPTSVFHNSAIELLKALLYRINLFPKNPRYRNCVENILSRDMLSRPNIFKKEDLDPYFVFNMFSVEAKAQTLISPKVNFTIDDFKIPKKNNFNEGFVEEDNRELDEEFDEDFEEFEAFEEQFKKTQSIINNLFVVKEFSNEEMDFLEEENISIQDSDSKWSWLTNELAEKYFVSVLLPYYIIKPNLTYDELDQLGFGAFISKLKRQKIHFSQIKNKYLNVNSQKLIDLLSEKFGLDTTSKKLENAKIKLTNITETISRTSILRSRDKLKLSFDLDFFPIKCKECNVGVDLFFALQLHHPTKSKEIELSNIYNLTKDDYKLALERFKKDKIELLCSNHHLEKHIFYPITFKDIIFKEDLFSMSAEEIDAYIDKYLSLFFKTERYREIIYEKYKLENKEVPKKLNNRWKQQIKKWIKKRFIFNELFGGKCIICGDSNLLHLDLHHMIPELKNLAENWQSIANLDCDEIMRVIINEKCVSLCSICHDLITFKYHISIREILKGFFAQHEIDKISEKVAMKYNDAIEKISNFKYDLENINFKDPLKLEFSQKDIWKINLMTIYCYLEIKDRRFFLSTEIIYDLELSHNFLVVIKNLIDLGFIQKSDPSINYSLTQKGKDKSLELIQKHCEKVNEIKKILKKILNNKGKYEFLDYTYSKENNCYLKKKIHSRVESIFKYCIIIYDLITNKGINEFTTSELIPFIRNNDNDLEITISNRITETLRSVLIPFNLIEKVDNAISYSYKKKNINDSKMLIGLAAKVYKLTDKGVDIAKNGFDSL